MIKNGNDSCLISLCRCSNQQTGMKENIQMQTHLNLYEYKFTKRTETVLLAFSQTLDPFKSNVQNYCARCFVSPLLSANNNKKLYPIQCLQNFTSKN